MSGDPAPPTVPVLVDYFALLRQPRRPWLDEALLRQQFLARSGEAHPDRVHAATPEARAHANRTFADLNAAYNCLKEPRDRVRHLVELEWGRKPGDLEDVPRELADTFMQIATVSRATARLLAEKAPIQSPLLLAAFIEKIQPHLDLIEQLMQDVTRMHAAALEQLRALDAAWEAADNRGNLLPRLAALAQVFGFHARWQAQLRESQFRLML